MTSELLEKLNQKKEAKTELVEQVRRFGGSASEAVLESSCTYFRDPSIDGFIAYRQEPGCAVVYGDPICDPKEIPALTKAFQAFCKEKNLHTIFLTVSEKFAEWAMEHICTASIEFGRELSIDPHQDPKERTGVKGSLVRRKVRHAEHEGVTVKEYLSNDVNLEKQIINVGRAWLKSRKGFQIYTARVRLFEDRVGKRWFYALKDNRVIGVLSLNQLQKKNGWLINRYMVVPQAPGGTPELLIITALDTLKKENCPYVSFGVIPHKKLGEITGLGKISTWIARFIFKIINRLFRLDGKREFWEKFHPTSIPSYILFSNPSLNLRDLRALTKSLNVNFKS